MPNIDYDPRNPTDLLGRPIAPGDMVAWGTTYGRSPAVCVAQIERINFTQKVPGEYGKYVKCDRSVADRYTLTLQPLKSTGHVNDTEYVSGGFIDENGNTSYFRRMAKPKLKTVQIVKNVVKLEPIN